jgi:hypothetical protein
MMMSINIVRLPFFDESRTGLVVDDPAIRRRKMFNCEHLIRIVVEIVRREKALDFSRCKSRPGTGSLHPVAIEAAAEATKLSELSMERVAWRLRERTGRNVSER